MKATIPDSARSGGLAIFAPPGWGKSRLLGRRISFQDTMRGTGQVVIDVIGQTIDNLLDKVLYLPRDRQVEIGRRLVYCNMRGVEVNGETYVCPWPILFQRHPSEPLDTAASRIIDLIDKTDRNLKTASVMGMNRLSPQLKSFGICLTALGEPMVAVFDMLERPQTWEGKISALAADPECKEAANYALAFFAQSKSKQIEETGVLKNKLSFLRFNPVNRTMFSTSPPLIDWEEVVKKGKTVLIDLRGIKGEALELKLFWVWNTLTEYIIERSRSCPPFSIVLDELSFFVRGHALNTDLISEEFRELIQVRKRNANIWLTAATQEMAELPQAILTASLQMGNLLFGATVEDETALRLSGRFDTIDPLKLKDSRVLMGFRPEGYSTDPYAPRTYGITGEQKTFYTFDEQKEMESGKYKALHKEDWFFAQIQAEGHVPTQIRKVTTRNLDPGQFVNEQLVRRLKARLMIRDGVKVQGVVKDPPVPEEMPPQTLNGQSAPERKEPPKPRRTGRRRFVEE